MESNILPRHEDFQKIHQNFIDEYGEEEGENNYHAWLNKHGYDDTKPMPKKEGFSWAGSIKEMPGVDNLIRGKALHPLRTVHPEEWPEVREYLEEELDKSAHTLSGKPLILDHFQVLQGKVLGAEYEDGAIEYVAQLNDPEVMELVRNGAIKHCSVEFEWKSLEQVNGVAPRGINFTGLSLLRLFQPGDPKTTVEVWEGIIKELKEARSVTTTMLKDSRSKEQAEPQEFILYSIRDPAAFLEERFSTAWIDIENGIQAIYGRLREDPENPQPMALLFMKAKSWTLEKMQGWLQDHSQYLRQPKPAVAAPAGVQSVSPTSPMTQEGTVEMNTQAGGNGEDGEQGEQEPEKDEHGCLVGKERYDKEQAKCVPIEGSAAESEKKSIGEAIIAPEKPPEPALVVPVEKLEAVLPSLQAERSMSWGAQRFTQDVKRLIREAKEGPCSG